MGMNIDLVKIFKVPTEIRCPDCGLTFDAKDDLEDQDIEEYFCPNPAIPELHKDGLEGTTGCPKCDNSLRITFKINTTIKSIKKNEDD